MKEFKELEDFIELTLSIRMTMVGNMNGMPKMTILLITVSMAEWSKAVG